MQPSDFQEFPWSSVTKNNESERIALNIITILERTENVWRDLSWDEYREERLKDLDFNEREKGYFDTVQPYTRSAETAALFCGAWKYIFNHQSA